MMWGFSDVWMPKRSRVTARCSAWSARRPLVKHERRFSTSMRSASFRAHEISHGLSLSFSLVAGWNLSSERRHAGDLS